MPAAHEDRPPARPGLVAGAILFLFSLWSASFIAFEALLTPEAGEPRFDWLSLTGARYVPVALLSGIFCFCLRRAESVRVVRKHWRRLLLCGLLIVPAYNFSLYGAQQSRVPAPIASLLTALTPLFVMLLSAGFLGERITRRRALGLLLALVGLVFVARAKDATGAVAYPLLVALGVGAPLSWSVHSVLTKPVVREVSPLLWTYLAMCFGGLPFLLVLPFAGLPEMLALDASGWATLGYLALLCNLVGYAIWTWLLARLPATSVGFTVFLNPPMTTAYKLLAAALFPAAFTFALAAGEAVGGLLLLAGVAVALAGAESRR